MSASQRLGLGSVHIERKPIPFIIISITVETNVCNTEAAARPPVAGHHEHG